MKIVSNNGATILNDDGVEYVAENGGFEVPQAVGERLVKGPAFDREYVANDRKSAAEVAAAESRDGVLKRLDALEAAVFPDRAPTPVPEPTPAPEPVPSAPVTPEPVVEEPAPADPEPVVEPAPETPVEDVPVQSDASPVDAPPIAEPDAPVDIPVENVPGEVVNEDGSPSADVTPVVVSDEEAAAALPAIVGDVSEDSAPVDPAAE